MTETRKGLLLGPKYEFPPLNFFRKTFQSLPLLLGPPLIKFSILLGETCKKLVLLLNYSNNEGDMWQDSEKYLLAATLIGVLCIFADCCIVTPILRPPPPLISSWGLFQPPAYYDPPLIRGLRVDRKTAMEPALWGGLPTVQIWYGWSSPNDIQKWGLQDIAPEGLFV